MNAAYRQSKHYCTVCERLDHDTRVMPDGSAECPARVIRVLPDSGIDAEIDRFIAQVKASRRRQ